MENKTILCSDIDDFIQKYDIDIYQKIQGCRVRCDQYSLTSEEYKNLYDLILTDLFKEYNLNEKTTNLNNSKIYFLQTYVDKNYLLL